MWPFREKHLAMMFDGHELPTARLMRRMREDYPIGCMFPYIGGRRCTVVAYRDLRMVVHYADDSGVIRELEFEWQFLCFLLRPEVVARKFMSVEERRQRGLDTER